MASRLVLGGRSQRTWRAQVAAWARALEVFTLGMPARTEDPYGH